MTYIAHHGILGMKWGIRRYQNKDGTLTAAGRRRYQVMTNPETGEQLRSAQFTPEQLARAKEHGYTVEDVEERDEKGIEEARAHRKRMVAIGTVVAGVAITALLVKGVKFVGSSIAEKRDPAKDGPSAFAKLKAARAHRQLEKLKTQKELDAISAKYKSAQEAATKASNAEWAKHISNLKNDLKTTSDANTKLASNASSLAKAASYTSELIKKLDGK